LVVDDSYLDQIYLTTSRLSARRADQLSLVGEERAISISVRPSHLQRRPRPSHKPFSMPALYINEKDSLHSSLLPCTDANPRAEPTASVLSSHKKLFLSLLAISTVSYSVAYSLSSSVITPTSSSLSTADSSPLVDLSLVQGGAQCVQPSAVPLKKSQEGRSDWVYDEEFKKLEVERFLGSIRIPTQSVSSSFR
jgi:hypothetical protein